MLAQLHAGCCTPQINKQRLLNAAMNMMTDQNESNCWKMVTLITQRWAMLDERAFFKAIETGNEMCLHVLISIMLELINHHDNNGNMLLISALYTWQESIVELLLDSGTDTNTPVANSSFKTLLHMAMEQNLPFSVTALLDHSTHTDTVNRVNYMPLQLAEVLSHHHMVHIINKCMHCNKAF
jgi:hypothetical protein